MSFDQALASQSPIVIRQKRELAELVGFETRNKYAIELESGISVGFAAEQGKGLLGLLMRQLLGHWRSFTLLIFDNLKQPVLRAEHPFRFFFQRLEIFDAATGTRLGALQQRFALITKKFDFEGPHGELLFEVRSPIWRIWTFPILRPGHTKESAVVEKKWGGLLREAFTDADRFRIRFEDPTLTQEEQKLIVAAGLFIDLIYFEKKANSRN